MDEESETPMRPFTPPQTHPDGTRTIRVHRCCNGCGTDLGDATDLELSACIAGHPMPDVRSECPTCTPTRPTVDAGEPAVVVGA